MRLTMRVLAITTAVLLAVFLLGCEEGEEIDIDPLEKGVIDLREMITEQIHLSLPVKPLCEENCRGLCSRCGVDLNKETCSCADGETDPRWEALKQLKVQ